MYNKSELLGSSQNSSVLETALEAGGSVDLGMRNGRIGVDAREAGGQEFMQMRR